MINKVGEENQIWMYTQGEIVFIIDTNTSCWTAQVQQV